MIGKFGARCVLIAALPLVLATGGCVQDIKQDRVKLALLNAGLPEQLSDCMAHRLAQKLSIAQLRRLQALGDENRSYFDYLDAVRRVHDPDAMEVLISSAALCRAGLIH